jgi:hypothetical protein
MAATAAASPHQAQNHDAVARLAVGATVVRPVQLTRTVSANGAGLLVRNAQGVDVQAAGGTTEALDENTVAVKPKSRAIIVTITY